MCTPLSYDKDGMKANVKAYDDFIQSVMTGKSSREAAMAVALGLGTANRPNWSMGPGGWVDPDERPIAHRKSSFST